jgi:bifunctional DNase/RNase
VVRVEVVTLKDDTFFGNIVVESDSRILNIDARPSDALAIAVRTRVPILVTRSVIDAAGIIPEEDLQQELESDIPELMDDAKGEETEERLSVFQDFLEGLDIDKLDEESDDEDEK